MPSDPTTHEIALALAALVHEDAEPRDVIYNLSTTRRAAARLQHRSSGGSVLGLAHTLHSGLYGLPTLPSPLPSAPDALLQATLVAQSGDQREAILRQLGNQLRNAADIIEVYRSTAHLERLPPTVENQLLRAHRETEQAADTLHSLASHFSKRSSSPSPSTAPAQDQGLPLPQPTATPPGGHRR
ncbi:hypothetical protein JGS22_014945 [Streptomyces sp. P38-E01]|uniref:Uncharacterized protein n=1 Tax=Streptomyces tardus TaxID=2780544 RepID=A0A949JPI0_9ACTN|nr:hypothetical protein [Streptomyces tardus]MBU7598876.1 hypothetical protein [Streptomyces tardus]